VNYSFIAIFLILLLAFRRIELVIISIIPILISWLFTTGIMGIFGLQFNVINIIVCTLIFGIGVDYSIFMTMALQKEQTFGKVELPTYRTSILLSVATTILGIGVLIFAGHPALKSIAAISIIGIFSALLITFILQPLVFDFFVTNRVKKGQPPFEIKRLLHSVLSFTYFGLGGFLLSMLGSFFVKFFSISKEKKVQLFHYLMSKFMHSVFLTYPSIKRKIINTSNENFDKPAVIIANHTSFLDILAVGMLSPKIIFLVSDWVYNSPIFGRGVRLAGFYPVSNGIGNGVEHLREKVNQGFSLMVFPEGTRSVDNSVKRFHKGAFYLAEEFKLDIVPVVIHGYSEASPKGDFMLYKASTTVEILERISPTNLDFGQNYTERAKKINNFFRIHIAKMRLQYEDADYFKSTLLNSFAYKETDIIQSVKDDFIENSRAYYELNSFLGSKSKILHFSDDYGQLDVLLALQQSQRKIDCFIENEIKRSCAKTNHYLKKRGIRYFDSINEIDSKIYESIVITSSSFSFEIDSFTGTVILFNNEVIRQKLINSGFKIMNENSKFIILKQ
jgi:1-acyl-sn-glycerol-3-phosphate acyltransferase